MRKNGPHTKDQLLCRPFRNRHTFKWAYLALIGRQQTLVRTPRFEQRLWRQIGTKSVLMQNRQMVEVEVTVVTHLPVRSIDTLLTRVVAVLKVVML